MSPASPRPDDFLDAEQLHTQERIINASKQSTISKSSKSSKGSKERLGSKERRKQSKEEDLVLDASHAPLPVRSASLSIEDLRESANKKVDPLAVTVMAAGAMLASCAGMTNAVAFRALGAFVSHVTGSLSKASLHGEAGSMEDAFESLLLVACFCLGSAVCGCLIAKNTVTFGQSLYGLALIGNASLLVLGVLCEDTGAAAYLLAAACGLQNGMATSYSGAVIRTTHVTGLCTDVGLLVGRAVAAGARKQHRKLTGASAADTVVCADFRKLMLLLLLGTSFLIGVFFGSLMHGVLGLHALLLPAAVLGTAGACYSAYRYFILRQPLLPRSDSMDASSMELGAAGLKGGELFQKLDKNGDGIISKAELAQALEAASVNGAGYGGPCRGQAPAPQPGGVLTAMPVAPKSAQAAEHETRHTPDRVPVHRLLHVLDSMEPSIAELTVGGLPGMSDLQGEALEAHQKLRSVVAELTRDQGATA